MNPRVHIFVSMIFPLYPFLATFDFDLTSCVILFVVSLANALVRVTSLEATLKTTSKALKEADEKRVKEVSTAKVSADKAVKEAEARAIKAEKSLAEVSQRQAKREEDVVKRLDDILTSVGSKYSLALVSTALSLFFDMPFFY
jgi:predicted KAP-like P-loop ATPase